LPPQLQVGPGVLVVVEMGVGLLVVVVVVVVAVVVAVLEEPLWDSGGGGSEPTQAMGSTIARASADCITLRSAVRIVIMDISFDCNGHI
jgi:hypothetical protein